MKPQYNFKLGFVKCSSHSINQFLEEIELLLKERTLQPRTLLCVNAHIFNLSWQNSELRDILNAARIVTADGMSIVLASRLFRQQISERCNMTEAFRAFLKSNKMPQNTGVLIGLTEKEVLKAKKNIEDSSKHCHIVKSISGYLTENQYKQILTSFGDVDFIFIGMSSPRTEKITKIVESISKQAIVWHIGAGTIKIFAGTMKEAPVFFRSIGLQWLHRLLSDPINLWRRYLVGNLLFIYRILKLALQTRRKYVYLDN